jgi:hypothetical protein
LARRILNPAEGIAEFATYLGFGNDPMQLLDFDTQPRDFVAQALRYKRPLTPGSGFRRIVRPFAERWNDRDFPSLGKWLAG